jgi:hypothetical protein
MVIDEIKSLILVPSPSLRERVRVRVILATTASRRDLAS